MPAPIHIFGLGLPVRGPDDSAPRYARVAHPAIDQADVLVGGKAQLAAYEDSSAQKLVIGKDMDALYAAIRENREAGLRQVVLCGGDPLFFGLGARLAELTGPEDLHVHPGVSSLQAAACLANMPWESVRAVSLHGRSDWLPLAHALLAACPVLVLLDSKATPAAIASWMLQRGLWRFSMLIMENLYLTPEGDVAAADMFTLSLPQAQSQPAAAPAGDDRPRSRVVFIRPETSLLSSSDAQPWPFGLSDSDVVKENKLLTKSPVRAAALASLGIEPRHVIWDLGAGSGAVSLEAARLAWQGVVYAVEKNPDRLAAVRENRKRYGAANLEIIEGEMPACLPEEDRAGRGQVQDVPGDTALPCPDRIFIGGGLGGSTEQASAIVSRAWSALKPGGRLLVDCVLLSSLERARAILLGLGAKVSVTCLQASTSSPLAQDMRLEALNPVFLVLAEKSALSKPT